MKDLTKQKKNTAENKEIDIVYNFWNKKIYNKNTSLIHCPKVKDTKNTTRNTKDYYKLIILKEKKTYVKNTLCPIKPYIY